MSASPNSEQRKAQLEALLHESEQVNAMMNRTLTLAHNIIGLFLPASLGLFVLGSKELGPDVGIDLLSLIIAAIFCTARLYADTLWTEFLEYWRYNFSDLQPRIYAFTGQADRRNLGQSILKGWPSASSFPMLIFHVVTFIFVLSLTVYGVWAFAAGLRRNLVLSGVLVLMAVAVISAFLAGSKTRKVSHEVTASFARRQRKRDQKEDI